MTVVGQTAPGPALRFAGDSRLARAASGAGVELWDVTSAPTLSFTFQSAVAQDDQNPLIEALSSGGLAVFSHNSFQIGVVNPATGSTQAFALVSPEITAASVYYKKYNGTSTVPAVITASGFDRSGRLSILISPYFNNIGTVLSIDTTSGTVTGRMQFALPPRSVQEFGVPHSIVGNSTETGIVYTDGSVAWYQA
jgi:Na+/phosphate symporter